MMSENLEQIAFRAALAGARELPDEVAAFALDAAERTNAAERLRPTHESVMITFGGSYEAEIPPPWTDGPYGRVNESFVRVVLQPDTLGSLIGVKPEIAREVLLAVLIDEPSARDPYEYSSELARDQLDINQIHSWFPPLYFRGPFVSFLTQQPEQGVEVILRLVNFAFEQWAAHRTEREESVPSVKISLAEGERTLLGDFNVYLAYRDHGPWPHAVVAALMALEKWLYDQLDAEKRVDRIIETILQRGNSVAFAGVLMAVGCKHRSLFSGPLRPLLAVPEFHYWENARMIKEHSEIQMMGWFGKGVFANLARDWHGMPHRKCDWYPLAQYLFFSVPEIRGFLEEQSHQWDERGKTESDPQMAHFLKQLAPRFRAENYHLTQDPQHGRMIIYQTPEALRLENERIAKKVDDDQLLLTFPLRCAQILDNGTGLKIEELQGFWETIQRIAQLRTPIEHNEDGIVRVEDAICGGISVLFTFHRHWLKSNSDKEKWCVEQIKTVLANPPKPGRFAYESDTTTFDWGSFCARIVPILWAEEPASSEWRGFAAFLVTSYKYKTVEILFATAAKYRKELGDGFSELQDFIFDWAEARWQSEFAGEKFDVVSWTNKEINAFANHQRPTKGVPWKGLVIKPAPRLSEMPLPSPRTQQRSSKIRSFLRKLVARKPSPSVKSQNARQLGLRRLRSKRQRGRPDFDFNVIRSAYSWLPNLDDAADAGEREAWLEFWQQALRWSLEMIGTDTNEDDEIDGMPTDWDEWVFGRIGSLILQLDSPQKRKAIWQPILQLGVAAHYWIEAFLRKWFYAGLGTDIVPKAFASEWREMIEFALKSSKWGLETGRGFRREGMWKTLMGFDLEHLWMSSHKQLLASMRDLYEKWAQRHLRECDFAIAFANFLTTPASDELICCGIVWLDTTNLRFDRRGSRANRLADAIASLLATAWQRNPAQIKDDQAAFAAFKNLLKRLSEIQHSVALELSDRLRLG